MLRNFEVKFFQISANSAEFHAVTLNVSDIAVSVKLNDENWTGDRVATGIESQASKVVQIIQFSLRPLNRKIDA